MPSPTTLPEQAGRVTFNVAASQSTPELPLVLLPWRGIRSGVSRIDYSHCRRTWDHVHRNPGRIYKALCFGVHTRISTFFHYTFPCLGLCRPVFAHILTQHMVWHKRHRASPNALMYFFPAAVSIFVQVYNKIAQQAMGDIKDLQSRVDAGEACPALGEKADSICNQVGLSAASFCRCFCVFFAVVYLALLLFLNRCCCCCCRRCRLGVQSFPALTA